MDYFYLIYLFIPILIILNIFSSDEKKVRLYRFIGSIPSILLLIGIGVMYYLNYKEVLDFQELVDTNPFLFFIPIIITIICIISYSVAKKKEKLLYVDIGSTELENIRYNKKKQVINITDK